MEQERLHLLHVEDDDEDAKAVQRALARTFNQNQFRLSRVASLGDALDALRGARFDAILLDLHLGDMRGLGNVWKLKSEHPDVPIVVLSTQDDTGLAIDAVRQGAQEYVVKSQRNGREMGLAVLSSIERKAYERMLFRQANHDDLTGLPNRRMFMEYMRQWLLRASRWDRREAIMFLDVNGFKQVNDTFGHDMGDTLLEQIAARLRGGLRASDMVARYAGDEFAIHLDMAARLSHESCEEVANKIGKLFNEPFGLGKHEVHAPVSIGIAIYPEHGKDIDELIQRADMAMYEAKRAGAVYRFAAAAAAAA